MKPIAWALLAMAASAAAGFTVWRARGPKNLAIDVAGVDNRSLDLLSCDEGDVWLRATTRMTAETARSRGLEAALAERRSALIEASLAGALRESSFGPGLIISFHAAKDGSLWTVLLEERGTPDERARIFRSTDGGVSWLRRDGPLDLIGVAFETRDKGYAWSRGTVYRTENGGESWRSVDLGEVRLERGDGGGRPVLDALGTLWVPTNSQHRPILAALVAIAPSLTRREIGAWNGAAVDGVAPDGAGGALVVVSPMANPGIRVERLSPAATGYANAVVRERRGVAVAGISRRGNTVLLHEVSWNPKAKPLSSPPQSIVTSPDSGEKWSVADVTGDDVESVCLADGGYWTLSAGTRRVVFHPLSTSR